MPSLVLVLVLAAVSTTFLPFHGDVGREEPRRVRKTITLHGTDSFEAGGVQRGVGRRPVPHIEVSFRPLQPKIIRNFTIFLNFFEF